MKTKKNTIQHIAIALVVISLIVITAMLMNNNIDFVKLVMKLHGG
jgi:hypothetical protein